MSTVRKGEQRSIPLITKRPGTSTAEEITQLLGMYALPRWLSGKELACQCRRCKRHRFNPWVGRIPWRKKLQPIPVLLPGKSHGQRGLARYSPWGHEESDTTRG